MSDTWRVETPCGKYVWWYTFGINVYTWGGTIPVSVQPVPGVISGDFDPWVPSPESIEPDLHSGKSFQLTERVLVGRSFTVSGLSWVHINHGFKHGIGLYGDKEDMEFWVFGFPVTGVTTLRWMDFESRTGLRHPDTRVLRVQRCFTEVSFWNREVS